MSLAGVPAFLILAGLAAYAVLGGADFGAGFWQLTAGGDRRGRAIREHAYHAMGPVWESNNVWLIFVLVICWTAYPVAFGSIASTLAVPLFIAAVGIILRGAAYALRSAAVTPREERRAELIFSLSSILTPFALGAAIGGIASGRVPVGNAQGDLFTSWLNPTSLAVGAIAVVTAAYLAAVYLAADARRLGDEDLTAAFRARALGAGVVAGAVALGGLAALRWDAEPIWNGLTHGWGLAALAVSAAAGIATLALVWAARYQAARGTAALAVAAIVAGWGLAQRPQLLPGLTIQEAAASRGTLIALLIGVAAGAVVLVPSLALLFSLFLRGRFDPAPSGTGSLEPVATEAPPGRAPLPALGVACFLLGFGLTAFADPPWARAVGIVALFGFIATTFLWIVLPDESG